MKLNYKRTILVGFAFFLICAFWQAYDTTIPLILTNKFGMSQTWSGVIMAADNVLALTISHNLSGSYNAALSAREMVLEDYPEKKIFILDTLSCAGALAGAAKLANRLIGEGKSFAEVCAAVQQFNDEGHILFALASFEVFLEFQLCTVLAVAETTTLKTWKRAVL